MKNEIEFPFLITLELIKEYRKYNNRIMCSNNILSEAKSAGFECGSNGQPYFSKRKNRPQLVGGEIEFLAEIVMNSDITIIFPNTDVPVICQGIGTKQFSWGLVKPELFDMFVRGYAEGFLKRINRGL